VAESVPFKYRAFLSYSHRDKTWGQWLHRALETHRIDKDMVGLETPVGPVPKTLRPIFRDREDFTAGHSLTAQTLAALEASQFLIVLCSPNAAQSEYVNEEIRRFKVLGRADRVIPVIVGGGPDDPARECFPPALRFKVGPDGALTNEREEPIAADARPEGDGKEIAKQKVVAGLLGVGLDEITRRARRAQKRHALIRNGVVAALLALTVTSAGGFAWARYELSRNEALLDRTLQTATTLTGKAVAMSERFGVPRTMTLGILEEAESLFRDMAELGRETTQLRHRKAWMLIAFARNYEVLGDITAQRSRASEAHRLMQGLAAENVIVPEVQRTLSAAYNEVGNVLAAQGNLGGALGAFSDSVAILERLVKTYPNNLLLQGDLSVSNERVGDMLRAEGNLSEALKVYRDTLAIDERLAEADPANSRWQHNLSMSNDKIGDVLVAQDNFTDGLQSYLNSLAIRDRMAKAEPQIADWQHGLAVSHTKVGDVLVVEGNLSDALKAFHISLTIFEHLAKADPHNASWRRDLAVGHTRLANVYRRLGKAAEALAALREGRQIIMELVARLPDHPRWKSELAWFEREIAVVEWANDARPADR
jgi:tetratricopeptide (TPR) repeat protein